MADAQTRKEKHNVRLSGKFNDARAKVLAVGDKAKKNKEYASEVRQDPIGKLREAGVPDPAIADFLREEDLIDDVGGYAFVSPLMNRSIQPPSINNPTMRRGPGMPSAEDCSLFHTCLLTEQCGVSNV